jgi:PGF-pre-PGF domain-containing protein
MWNVVLYDNVTNSLLNDTNSANWNVTVDTAWPIYSNTTIFYQPVITYSPYQYSNFSITWTEANIAGVYIENNFTGTLIKTSMLGSYPMYYYNSTPLQAGRHMFRFIANDSAGNTNATGYINFTIGPAGQLTSLSGITNDTYPYSVTPACVGNLTYNLYRNSSLASNNTAIELGAAEYQWICNTTTNSNYTFNSATVIQSVSQAAFFGSLTGISNHTYSTTDTPVCAGNLTSHLYLNDSNTTTYNNIAILFGTGDYLWTCNATANVNYTSSSITVEHSISQNTSYGVNIYLNGTRNTNSGYTYPSYVNIIGNSTLRGCGNITVYRNNTFLFTNTPSSGSGTTTFNELLANKTYNYTVNTTGNVNCTANATGVSVYVYMGKGDPSVYIGVYIENTTFLNNGGTYPVSREARGNVSTIPGGIDLTFALYQDYLTLLAWGNTTNETVNTSTQLVGSYTYVYNTSGGQNWTAGTSISKFLVISAATATTVPSSGGGGGGGSSNINTETGILTKKYDSIAISVPKTITESDLSVTSSSLTEINFDVKERATDVTMTVEKISDVPASTGVVAGTSYNYVKIEKTNLNDSNIGSAHIKFKVPKLWLTNNSIDSSTVSLYRFTTQWDKLATAKLSEDSNYVYYQAETPGFSYFAIAGTGAAVTTTLPPTTIPPATTIPATTTTVIVPSVGKVPTELLIVLVLIVIVVVVLLAVMRNKKLQKKIESNL